MLTETWLFSRAVVGSLQAPTESDQGRKAHMVQEPGFLECVGVGYLDEK
jgi:hypothetical protein